MISTEWSQFLNLIQRLHKTAHHRAKELAGPPPSVQYTSTQINALHAISTRPEWRMSDLSKRLRVSAGSLTTMINRLIEVGLVERNRSAEDRRVVTVKLTKAGEELLAEGQRRWMDGLEDILSGLSDDDRRQLDDALRTVVEILTQIT